MKKNSKKMMEDKNKNLIIIALSIAIGISVYFAVSIFLNGGVGTTMVGVGKTQKDYSVGSDYDELSAKELVGKFVNNINYNLMEIQQEGLTDNVKLTMAISDLLPDTKAECSEAFDITLSTGQYFSNEGNGWGCEGTSSAYSYELVNTKYKELFGKDAPKIDPYGYKCDYSSKLGVFVSLRMFGTSFSTKQMYDVISAKEHDGKLTIEIIYMSYVYNDMHNIYPCYLPNGKSEDANSLEEVNKIYNDNKATLPHMTFNFVKDAHGYVLESITASGSDISSEESNEQGVNYNVIRADELIEKYSNANLYFDDLKNSKLTDDIMVSMAVASVNSDKKVKCGDAFDLTNGTYVPSESYKYSCYENDNLDAYSYDLVNSKYRELFGKDAPKTAGYHYVYAYSNNSNSYAKLTMKGTDTKINVMRRVISAKLNGDKLAVEFYYLDYQEQMDRVSYVQDGNVYSVKDITAYFNSHIDTLHKMTFNFVKSNDNFVLESIN